MASGNYTPADRRDIEKAVEEMAADLEAHDSWLSTSILRETRELLDEMKEPLRGITYPKSTLQMKNHDGNVI